jgi:hypothetical protein
MRPFNCVIPPPAPTESVPQLKEPLAQRSLSPALPQAVRPAPLNRPFTVVVANVDVPVNDIVLVAYSAPIVIADVDAPIPPAPPVIPNDEVDIQSVDVPVDQSTCPGVPAALSESCSDPLRVREERVVVASVDVPVTDNVPVA